MGNWDIIVDFESDQEDEFALQEKGKDTALFILAKLQ